MTTESTTLLGFRFYRGSGFGFGVSTWYTSRFVRVILAQGPC